MSVIATLEEAKLYIDDEGDIGTKHDALLQMLLDSAEEAVARYTRRLLWPEPALVAGEDTAAAVAKTFHVGRSNGRMRSVIRVPDLRSATGLTLGGGTLASGDWRPIGTTPPYGRIRLFSTATAAGIVAITDATWDQLVITGRWGFNPPPKVAKDAVLTLVGRAFAERRAKYGDSVENVESGAVAYFRELPSRVKWMLRPLRRPAFGVIP